MTLEQASHAFRITPIWFWPILWWNLLAFRGWADAARARGEAGLYTILTDRKGRILIRWTAKADPVPQLQLTHPGPTQYEFDNLDLISRLCEIIVSRGERFPTDAGPSAPSPTPPAFAHLEPG